MSQLTGTDGSLKLMSSYYCDLAGEGWGGGAFVCLLLFVVVVVVVAVLGGGVKREMFEAFYMEKAFLYRWVLRVFVVVLFVCLFCLL